MLRRGEVLGGRFAVVGDPAELIDERTLWKRRFRGAEPGPIAEEKLWVRGVDEVSGATVRVVPRRERMDWAEDLRREAGARAVMSARPRGVVPVLHAGPGVVYAEPPTGEPRGTRTIAEAAAYTLAACEVVAQVHALGWREDLYFGPGNLKLLAGGEVAWLVPGIAALEVADESEREGSPLLDAGDVRAVTEVFGAYEEDPGWYADPVMRGLWRLTGLFFSLVDVARLAEARGTERFAALEVLAWVFLIKGPRAGVVDVAGLAGWLSTLVDGGEAWAERVATMPVVRVVPRMAIDWDAVIADGEALLATPGANTWEDRHPEYLKVPLAAAYHQRASGIFNCGGELEAALGEATRAVELDATVEYRTTRAVILDAMGRVEEARAEIEAAFATAPLAVDPEWDGLAARPATVARAHATRGAIALRERAYAQAESDLRRAWEVEPTAAHAHALGAVLHARGQVHAASQVEAEAVRLAPEEPRFRWALVVSLLRLRRFAEAQAQAEELLRMAPEVYGVRAREAIRRAGG